LARPPAAAVRLRLMPLDLLRQVSRTFALSLSILPQSVRAPIGLAYLFARAADTIADTRLVDRQDRLRQLEALREALAAGGRVPRLTALAAGHDNPAARAAALRAVRHGGAADEWSPASPARPPDRPLLPPAAGAAGPRPGPGGPPRPPRRRPGPPAARTAAAADPGPLRGRVAIHARD